MVKAIVLKYSPNTQQLIRDLLWSIYRVNVTQQNVSLHLGNLGACKHSPRDGGYYYLPGEELDPCLPTIVLKTH